MKHCRILPRCPCPAAEDLQLPVQACETEANREGGKGVQEADEFGAEKSFGVERIGDLAIFVILDCNTHQRVPLTSPMYDTERAA